MAERAAYVHTVQYYETDKMGITHHSNYIRWMEEARIDFLSQIGWNYPKLEQRGIVSPVIGVECAYKRPTTFADRVTIRVAVKEFRGVTLTFAYEMRNENGELVCAASSRHAFLNREGRPLRLNRDDPELYRTLQELAKENGEGG